MWKNYKKSGIAQMRPYVPVEDLTAISVSKEDTPELGGMIGRDPKDHRDQWYVSKQFYNENYETDDSEITR